MLARFLQPQEQTLRIVRRHWFIFIREVIGVVFIGLLPFVAITLFVQASVILDPKLTLFLGALWALAIWITAFTIWTNHYLDLWVITDRRIIDIDQLSLFHRRIVTIPVERIQDVMVNKAGIIATLLRFGDIQIQSAGGDSALSVLEGAHAPSEVRELILHEMHKKMEEGPLPYVPQHTHGAQM